MEENTAIKAQLPLEVLDAILDTIADTQCLRQCAVAARCLLPSAQRVLFRTVCLLEERRGSIRSSIERYHDLLETSPHLAHYTKELTLFLRPTLWARAELSENPLPFVVTRLHALETINVTILSNQRRILPKSGVTTQLHILLGGIQMPRVRKFVLKGLHVFTMNEVLDFCYQLVLSGVLQDLHIHWLTSAAEVLPSPNKMPVTPLALQTLTITGDPGVIGVFLDWATSCLQFTIGHLTERSFVHLSQILDAARGSLMHLAFEGSASLSSFQLHSLRRLRTMSYYLPLQQDSALVQWCTVFKQGEELCLERFVVRMNSSFMQLSTGYEPLDSFADHPWKEFEEALVNGTQCRQLELHVDVSHRRLDADVLRSCFPIAHASAGHDLIVKQKIMTLDEMVDWEYRSCFGEWVQVELEDFFDE